MATYFFETITAAQALTYSAATDSIVFTNPAATGAKMTVIYNAGTPATPTVPAGSPSVTLIDNVDGHTVTFGTGIYGEGGLTNGALIFPDGSNLFVGSTGADAANSTAATTLGDGLFGGDGDDVI